MMVTDKQFTGQQEEPGDTALGLYNYKARFYSTTLGTFASADTLVVDESKTAMLNHYAYVAGNPLKYVNPDGHCFVWAGNLLPCEQRNVLDWLRCGIQNACGVDLGRMARFALKQREFLIHAKFLASQDRAFDKAVREIRSPGVHHGVPDHYAHFSLDGSYQLSDDGRPSWIIVAKGDGRASLVNYTYSYFDIEVFGSADIYEREGNQADLQVRIWANAGDGSGWHVGSPLRNIDGERVAGASGVRFDIDYTRVSGVHDGAQHDLQRLAQEVEIVGLGALADEVQNVHGGGGHRDPPR